MPTIPAKLILLLCGGLSFGLFSGCQPNSGPPPAMPAPKVTVAHPVSYPVQSYYEYNGYLKPVETVEIRARVKGFLNEVHFAEGDEIKAGDRLYTIDSREYAAKVAKSKSDIAKAEADMANARAQIILAEAELTRLTKASDATSKSEVEKSTATVAANRAQLDVAAANKAAAQAGLQMAELELGYTDIRALIAGRISRTLVTRGNLVGQTDTTLLTTIVSVDPLHVFFDIPEKDLVAYQKSLMGKSPQTPTVTDFPVQVGVATEDGFPHTGVIDFREIRVDSGTGTVSIRGRIPNPASGSGHARELYPGLFARVRVPNGGMQSKLTLPEDALMTGQEGKYVFVIGKDNMVTKRTVTVGTQVWRAASTTEGVNSSWTLKNSTPIAPTSDPLPGSPPPAPSVVAIRSVVAIEKGLEAGDLVVVNGLQKARPGAPVAPETWEIIPVKK